MSEGLEALKTMVKDNDLELPYHNTILTIERELKALEIIREYVGVELIDIINAIREGIYFNDTTRCGTKEVYGEISSIQWFNDKWCFYIPRFATYIPIKEKDTCWRLSKKNMSY